ncbi:4-hydroxy-tetrahydrodipicolinate synthase [Mucisphaera calidilacus]|uniref:4-hydroxy-tetrahydrodipicolinate synthase n=1 Tax=Mucisphaera calidilacus TaxID=2527982 RepID=A0A518BXX2_9BACT|nr:4-hydroxy-tetrahydrodipicolinate synthase [Mucisphaera calidilacus]QDU71804.1 4-hydroxy-tetrahydrodipicolinate synthase [Mucisphaera calidilacus]
MTPHETIVWTACVTPLSDNAETVDFGSFERTLRRQEAAGNGILLIGTTGEGASLTSPEKRGIITWATGLNLSVPIMVGVPAYQYADTLDCVQWLYDTSVDALLVPTPCYTKPGRRGQHDWFRSMLDAAGRPCMLYNVPSRTGVPLPPETVSDLAGHPNLWSIKEASGSIERYEEFMQTGVTLYSGNDDMMPQLGQRGAAGLVSVASNLWPDETNAYARHCIDQTLTTDQQSLWSRAITELFRASNPVPAKRAMHALGLIDTPCLRPPLHPEDLDDLQPLLDLANQIRQENTVAA